MHFVKLIFRGTLFLLALISYIMERNGADAPIPFLPTVIWVYFMLALILRFFPSKTESMGCQKQFAGNYIEKHPNGKPTVSVWRSTLAVAVAWITLNATIGVLYLVDLIDKGILILVSLAYSVCDLICILFFCPFQTWFMKNRCCTTCRIYNWDFPMMFTPLIFLPGLGTYSLFGGALLLLFRWEITHLRHPERFYSETNAALDCANCKERLCSHKKQLKRFWKKQRGK